LSITGKRKGGEKKDGNGKKNSVRSRRDRRKGFNLRKARGVTEIPRKPIKGLRDSAERVKEKETLCAEVIGTGGARVGDGKTLSIGKRAGRKRRPT